MGGGATRCTAVQIVDLLQVITTDVSLRIPRPTGPQLLTGLVVCQCQNRPDSKIAESEWEDEAGGVQGGGTRRVQRERRRGRSRWWGDGGGGREDKKRP